MELVVTFNAHNVMRGYDYNLYPREWEMKLNKEQALALISELQIELKKLDSGEIDE